MSNTSLPLTSLLQRDVACGALCCVNACASDVMAIIFPDLGQLRSRRVVSRSNSHSAGKYPSWKMERVFHWESVHELNAFRLLDCNPGVTKYGEQPCAIEYVMDGVERVHYPDILAITTKAKGVLGGKSHGPKLLKQRFFKGPRCSPEYFHGGATRTEWSLPKILAGNRVSATQMSSFNLAETWLVIAIGKVSGASPTSGDN